MMDEHTLAMVHSPAMPPAFGGTRLESAVGSRASVSGDERSICVGTLAGGAVPSSTGDGGMESSGVGTLASGEEVPRMTGGALTGVSL